MYIIAIRIIIVFTFFLQPACDLDARAARGQTSLYLAVDAGNTKCVQYLIGYGASVEVAGPVGNTLLHLVVGLKNMKPLSESTTYLKEVSKEVFMCSFWFILYIR